MKRLRFKKLDAFATRGSSGNPAGAVYLGAHEELTLEEMQRVAQELKGYVSEVGFLTPLEGNSFRIRYFSATREVAFCGHATIAIMADLLKNNPTLATLPQVDLHTNKGILPVENQLATADAVYVQAPTPIHRTCMLALKEICEALNLPETVVDPTIPLGIVDAGNWTLCLPIRRLEDVLSLTPDLSTLTAFCNASELDVVTVFTRDTASPQNQLRTRVFAAPFGYLEDPATGSGNAALGYHLHTLGLWDGAPINVEQNGDRERPNLVRLASAPRERADLRRSGFRGRRF
ncbi:MAG: phenazine biosynthesis protein PhzF family [Holophagaceae bacterium]|nr:phenazine biosynthesis protein PhzF family [Holophagaceae bacterium]